jgi:hypothetical protein
MHFEIINVGHNSKWALIVEADQIPEMLILYGTVVYLIALEGYVTNLKFLAVKIFFKI